MCSFSFFRWILWSWQKVSCAFYNQNQLNLNLLRPTLANSGRMSDGSEIRLDYHEENEYKDAELHIGVVCYCLLDLRLPKVSDFDPNFPSCVRVSLLQVAEHRTITDILVTHSLHKPMSGFRVTSM